MPPFGLGPGNSPRLSLQDVSDLTAFLNTLTDNPGAPAASAFVAPHRCNETGMKATTIYNVLAALISVVLVVAAVIAASNTATAQSPPGGDAGGEHRGPPPEALAACKSAKPNQACSFVAPIGTVNGNCWQPDATHPLACRPEHGRSEANKGDVDGGSTEHRRPPPEALAACQGHKFNDACSFGSTHGTENGTCFQPDGSHPLSCRPARG
jgi:hypothetical protein